MVRPHDYALVVGINDYTPPNKGGLKPLKGAVLDAIAMFDWLVDADQGGLTDGHCHSLYSTKDELVPLQHSIDEKLDLILAEVLANEGKAERMYFYFAGHGFGVETNESDTALCVANWSQMKRRSALSAGEYWDLLVRFKVFKEVVFLSDCCRNTSFLIRPHGPTLDVFNYGEQQTVFLIGYSTQYMDQAYEVETGDENEKRGIFTQLLVKGLKGAAAKDGVVNAHNLKDYLEKHTPLEAQLHGYKQKPQVWTTATLEESIVFKKEFVSAISSCNIEFTGANAGRIELLNGNTDLIMVIDADPAKTTTIELGRGLYLLRNAASGAQTFFTVSQIGGQVDVKF